MKVNIYIYIYEETWFLLSGHGGEMYYKRISIKKIMVFWKLIILRDFWIRLPLSATLMNAYKTMARSPKSVFLVEKSFVTDDIEIAYHAELR